MEPSPRLEESLKQAIDRLWVEDDPESERALRLLRRMLDTMFPSDHPLTHEQAIRAGEKVVKAVYIHSHMDEETFDVARVMKCSIGVPETDGSNIPTCSYNVLYRESDTRFADAEMLERMGRTGGHRLLRGGSEATPRRHLPLISPLRSEGGRGGGNGGQEPKEGRS
jgi:hypothetical protein